MATEYVVSDDGARIAFDVAGSGPAVVLLAGHTEPRSRWHEASYVERLRGDFTVIAMDPRGQGESDEQPEPAAFYTKSALVTVEDVVAFGNGPGTDALAGVVESTKVFELLRDEL